MFRKIMFVAVATALVPAVAMAAGAKDELKGAVTKLADSPNYSWTTKVEGGFSAGAGGGKTEKDGPTSLAVVFGDDTYQVIINGDKAAAKGIGGWASLAELERDAEEDGNGFSVERIHLGHDPKLQDPGGPGQGFMRRTRRRAETGRGLHGRSQARDNEEIAERPAASPATAKGTQVDVTEPKGSVSFWIRDGALAKMEVHLQGVVTFNGKERRIDRTTTTVITGVGSTKVLVPEECREKL